MRNKHFNSWMAILLVLTLVSGMLPISMLTAMAETNGSYLDRTWDAESKRVISETKSIPYDAIQYTGQLYPESGKWYYLDGTCQSTGRMYVNGTMNLILCDGSYLSFDEGINVPEGSTLTVYGGEQGTGELNATIEDKEYYAAIGGGKKQNSGRLIVKGGKITAKSSSEAPAIGAGGGDYYHLKGNIDIYGGVVTATAGKYGAGIGAAYYGNMDGNVNIYGGEVNATGGQYGAGIGGGEGGDMNGDVNIYSGTVNANGGKYGAGIGGGQEWRSKGGGLKGTVNIAGGTVRATGGTYGAGIGGGEDGHQKGIINISGGNVTVNGGESGAGIGGGNNGNAGTVNISGGTVKTTGGIDGAGIGGGDDGDGGNITISGGTVDVFGGGTDGSAFNGGGTAIGGGYCGNQGGNITISGGTVNAETNIHAHTPAAIGGGSDTHSETINISGCTLNATAHQDGAAIGGSRSMKNGPINIFGGAKVVASSGLGSGIGCGYGNGLDQGGDIRIYGNAFVTASGHYYAAGIGAGGGDSTGGNATNIFIDNAMVVAGSSKGAGIGSGGGPWGGGDIGNIYINKSAVFAMSEKRGAGIGGGEENNSGNITIIDSYVEAHGGYEKYNLYDELRRDAQVTFVKIDMNNWFNPYLSDIDDMWAEMVLGWILNGEYGGAGIGGGDNGKGGKVTVEGNSIILATGGMNTTSAIGHGNSETDSGTLIIPDNSLVIAGDSSQKAKRIPTGDRIRACQNNQFAMIMPYCEHKDTSYRSVDLEYHEKYCRLCEDVLTGKEAHVWDNSHQCILCGAIPEWTGVTMKWRDVKYTRCKQEYKITQNSKYVLPECPEVPNGREFIGWRVNGNNYPYAYFEPGDAIMPTGNELTIEAVYLRIEETNYIDDRGNEQTVTARKIVAQNFPEYNYYLTSGWYVIGEETLTPAENAVFLIDGNVHLIIPDGCALTFDTDSVSGAISGDSLSIYGQKNMTGELNLRNVSRDIRSLTSLSQYGGVINAGSNAIRCSDSFTVKRGSLSAVIIEADKTNFIGGNSYMDELISNDVTLGWTELSDSIEIKIANVDEGKVKVADGQLLKNENDIIYTGAVSRVSNIECQRLTPYLEHRYGDPEWTWASDCSSATATFTCTDGSCGHIQTAAADVVADNKGIYTVYTASCFFEGNRYSDVKNINNKWQINIRETECGKVTASRSEAEYGKEIALDISPDEGYSLFSLQVLDSDENEISVSGNKFLMPADEVTVKAEFMQHFAAKEPYIDENGAYIPGNIEYVIDSKGDYYPVNTDGSLGNVIDLEQHPDALELVWFTFKTPGWITKYTGPTDGMTVLEIPKTYKGSNVTTLGNGNAIINNGGSQPFVLKLTENIMTIRSSAFKNAKLTKVTGDTSGLNRIGYGAFANVNSADDNQVEIALGYPGEVTADYSAFSGTNVTFRLQHATTVIDTSGAKSVNYVFTDAHAYGEPTWSWADDYSTATATFTCNDARCRHEEVCEAAVTMTETMEKTTYTAAVTFAGQTYTDERISDNEIGIRLAGHSLSLDGDIGINFYMELSANIADSDTAYMHFAIPTGTGTTETRIKVADARTVVSGDKTFHVFKCQAAAKEMTSEIKAQIIDGTKKGAVYTYSVKEYADYLLEHADENGTEEQKAYAAAVPLVKAMLNYGAYSQLQFDKNPGKLANADLPENDKKLTDVTIAVADPVIEGLPEKTTFEGATLSLKSETTLSLYFTSSKTLSFSCEGHTVETAASGGYKIARIRGIKAKQIGSRFTLNVNGGTVKYSPLNYCRNVLADAAADEPQDAQEEKLENVVKALYLYWQAANAYFPD